MILQDVGALTDGDQHRLLDWLDRTPGRTQVVSTTPAPLYPRVQAGAFIDRLYYRLNTVCMDVTGDRPAIEWPALRRITSRASARIAAPAGS